MCAVCAVCRVCVQCVCIVSAVCVYRVCTGTCTRPHRKPHPFFPRCQPELRLPETKVVTIGAFKIGVCHGHHVVPWGDIDALAALRREVRVGSSVVLCWRCVDEAPARPPSPMFPQPCRVRPPPYPRTTCVTRSPDLFPPYRP
jgi:hypothetical protein